MNGHDWWPARRAWIHSRPSREGLRAMARDVAPGAAVVSARRLGGGVGTASSMVRLRTRGGRTTDVVLKRYPADGVSAVVEWRRLRYAQRHLRVSTPEPLALDADGRWFGGPALVMGRLAGRPDVAPAHLDRWLDEIARVQLAIHETPPSRVPASLRAPVRWRYEPPKGLRMTPLVTRAVAYVRPRLARAAQRDVVLGHGDPHPGNLLWTRGRISGVTDLSHVRMFARARELAYTRVEIAVLLGSDAADAYLERYGSLLGRRVPGVAVWDVAQGLNGMRYGPLWAYAYREQGADLPDDVVVRRATAFVRRTLDRVT